MRGVTVLGPGASARPGIVSVFTIFPKQRRFSVIPARPICEISYPAALGLCR